MKALCTFVIHIQSSIYKDIYSFKCILMKLEKLKISKHSTQDIRKTQQNN